MNYPNTETASMFDKTKGKLLCDLLHSRYWIDQLDSSGHGRLAARLRDMMATQGDYYGTDFLQVLHRVVAEAELALSPAISNTHLDGLHALVAESPEHGAGCSYAGLDLTEPDPANPVLFDVRNGTDAIVEELASKSEPPPVLWLDLFLLASMQTIADHLARKEPDDVTREDGMMSQNQLLTIRVLSVRFGALIGVQLGRDLVSAIGMTVEQLEDFDVAVMW